MFPPLQTVWGFITALTNTVQCNTRDMAMLWLLRLGLKRPCNAAGIPGDTCSESLHSPRGKTAFRAWSPLKREKERPTELFVSSQPKYQIPEWRIQRWPLPLSDCNPVRDPEQTVYLSPNPRFANKINGGYSFKPLFRMACYTAVESSLCDKISILVVGERKIITLSHTAMQNYHITSYKLDVNLIIKTYSR